MFFKHNFKDIAGQRFGRLFVIKYHHTDNGGNAYWSCKCTCGKISIVMGSHLRHGKSTSCRSCGTKYGRDSDKKTEFIRSKIKKYVTRGKI